MNQKILITGISSGIGLFLAEKSLSEGNQVIGIARSETEELHSLKKKYNSELKVYHCDLSNLLQTNQIIIDVLRENLNISILVNNAGVYSETRKETAQKIEQTIAVNALTPLLITEMFLKYCGEKHGQILNVSSIGEKYGRNLLQDPMSLKQYSGNPVYNFSKLWLTALTLKIARDNPKYLVNCIHPGSTSSNLIKASDVLQMNWPLKIIFSIVRFFRRSPKKSATDIFKVIQLVEEKKISGSFFDCNKQSHSSELSRDFEFQKQAYKIASTLIKKALSKI